MACSEFEEYKAKPQRGLDMVSGVAQWYSTSLASMRSRVPSATKPTVLNTSFSRIRQEEERLQTDLPPKCLFYFVRYRSPCVASDGLEFTT